MEEAVRKGFLRDGATEVLKVGGSAEECVGFLGEEEEGCAKAELVVEEVASRGLSLSCKPPPLSRWRERIENRLPSTALSSL